MKKNMVYFVLYIVLLSELLAVITERDELQEVENQIRNKMIATIATMYKKPVFISIPEKHSEYNIKSEEPQKIIITPVGLYSDKEKKNVKFVVTLQRDSKVPPSWPSGGVTNNTQNKNFNIILENGNAVFSAKLTDQGDYKFNVFCELNRELPEYLPERLLKILRDEIGNTNLHQKSKVETFDINAKATGGLKKKEVKFSL